MRIPFSRLIISLIFFALSATVVIGQSDDVTTATGKADGKRIFFPHELKKGESYKVYRIDLREEIGTALAFHVHRAVEEIKVFKPDVVILNINTPGGSLGATQLIRDDLLSLEVPIYAYVNENAWSAGALLAVTADTIVMHPLASIGASQVILATGAEISEVVEQKINSALKAQIRGSARHKGHPGIICEAFIDRNIEIPGLSPKGEVLTLDASQATTETVYFDNKTSKTVVIPALAAFIAEDETNLLKQAGIWPAATTSYELTWSEKFAKYLLLVKPFLLLIGIGCLYYEMKAPGVGALGVIGVLALGLFFWGNMLAGLADHIEVVLFIIGILFLAVEIFIIPGFGIAGITGIGLMVTSLIMAMMKFAPPPEIPDIAPNYANLNDALMSFIYTFLLLIPSIWLIGKFLPHMPMFNRLILDPALGEKRDDLLPPSLNSGLPKPPKPEEIMGQSGTALTDLRPAGTAMINGRRLDVISEGDYVNKGDKVRIIGCEGNVHRVERITVETADTESQPE